MGAPDSDLNSLLRPRSIAFAGMSGVGRSMLEAHLVSGFSGQLYPISRAHSEVLGQRCYNEIHEIPGPVDYVFAGVPAEAACSFVDDCGRKGVKLIAFFTAGFGEVDLAGKGLEAELLAAARRHGVRILGPNCMGVYNPAAGLALALGLPQRAGPLGFFCQSGGNAAYCARAAARRGAFFSQAISYGNAVDLNECDFLEHFTHDPRTRVIGAYLEGVKDTRHFCALLAEAGRAKPVIVLKGGRTRAGGLAAAAHTGSAPLPAELWRRAMEDANAIEVNTIDELVDVALLFIYLKPFQGRNAAIVGLGGGASVVATDQCVGNGLTVPPFPETLRRELETSVRKAAGNILVNPTDPQPVPDGLGRMIRAIARWDGVDIILLRLPHNITPGYQDSRASWRAMLDTAGTCGKPAAMVLDHIASPEAAQAVFEEERQCWAAGLASFASVDSASRAVARLQRYYERRSIPEDA